MAESAGSELGVDTGTSNADGKAPQSWPRHAAAQRERSAEQCDLTLTATPEAANMRSLAARAGTATIMHDSWMTHE
jgi:hypothetical protein